MNRTLLRFIVCLGLVAVATAPSAAFDPFEARDGKYRAVYELRQDISLLNLLNGLHLTEEQTQALLEHARSARRLKQEFMQQYGSLVPEIQAAFGRLKAKLMDGEVPVAKPVEHRAVSLNEDFLAARQEYLRERLRIENRVRAVLTGGQGAIVEDFSPCLVPPHNLKNPSRAGQASDSSQYEQFLSRVRLMPDWAFAAKKDFILDRYIEKIEPFFGPMTEEKKGAERKRVFAIIREARAMSDTEFALDKGELAERFDPSTTRKALEKEFRARFGFRGKGKISQFLLDERIIPLLEARLEHSRDLARTSSVNLDTIRPADDCKGTGCGSDN